ncbi:MAG: hypothetical protein FWC50_03530 [Planctomycetaceae bacterium]|nr:hypothetical protein [Planctomycetaceae bacterium]
MSTFQMPKSAQQSNLAYVVEVTPQLAEMWLQRNFFNRKINEETVERLCRAMLAGHWRLTHQGIAFDRYGVLVDGQQRLEAVRRSGKTVRMLVFADQTLANHEAIDCGKVRTNLDVIRLEQRDSRITTKHLSTLRAMLAGRFCSRLNLSSKEINGHYRQHYSAVQFAVDQLAPAWSRQIDDPTVRGVMARAYYTVNETKLTTFCSWLCTPHKQPAIIKELADWLVKLPDHRETTRREIYKRTGYSLLAFAREREFVSIPFAAKELFSLN